MMRRILSCFGCCFVFASVCAVENFSARAAELADAVPESASVVIRLKAPRTTLGKVGDFVNEVQPGFGEAVKANLPALGLTISNPTLAGVDVEKDWWAIVFAESRQKPITVFVVPTTDADALKNALPPGFQFHSADKLAIYSDDEEILGQVRDRLSGKGTGLWSKLDDSSKKLFEASDVAVVVHLRQLAKAFENELNEAEPQLSTILNQITAASPEPQRQQLEMMLGMYRELGKAAVQGVRDSHSLTIGVTVSKDAIRVEDYLRVIEKTATAKFLNSQPTSELTLLNQLPANKLAYFGLRADISGMVDWSMNMTKAWLVGATDEQRAKIDEATKQMRGLTFGNMAGFFDLDLKSEGALRAASIAEVTPANRMRDISRSMLTAMREIQAPGFKQTITLEPAVKKVGGAEVDRLTMKQEFDPATDPSGIQQKMMSLLYGPDGMQQWILYQSDRTVQTFGGDTAQLEEVVRAINTKSSQNSAVVTARKRFVEKANVILLGDLARGIASGVQLAAREKVLPFPIDVSQIDGLQLQPSFIGIAMACEPSAARFQLEVPVAQAQGIARIVTLIMAQARAPRAAE